MADEHYRWLDPEAAERLLRGEPLENLDATARDQAERLLRALGALSAGPSAEASATTTDADAELPGEAAALAAFRKVRAEQADARAALGRPEQPVTRTDVDAVGLVRIGARAEARAPSGDGHRARPRRARWGRPLRLALAGALAAGAVGGVAAAATTGVLPTPFGGDEPGPAASVSAPAASERPLVSPSPDGTASGGGTAASGGGTSGSGGVAGSSPGSGATTPGQDDPTAAAGDPQEGAAGRWNKVASACRDLRDGRALGTGRKQALDSAAGGPGRVWTYCKFVLKTVDGRSGGQGGGDTGGNKGGGQGGQDGQHGHGHGNGNGNGNGNGGHGDDEGGHIGGGGRPGKRGSTHPPFGPSLPDRTATHSVPAPAPTYSAL
ncbi:extensin [Streptomyces anandii]|uniref:extensin n=1 Tax=Streptomyces anandii TaxID=285454 RepID=UPI0036F7A301